MGTKIDELMNDVSSNSLSQDENSMVDSIINDINGGSKQQQQSDWANTVLTKEQQQYAASDVLYLHQLKEILNNRLIRERRVEIAQACFDFLPFQAKLDLAGWGNVDIFSHSG